MARDGCGPGQYHCGVQPRTPFWRSSWWRGVLHPENRLASVEGLAAGTGLLTGSVARSTTVVAHCPACAAGGEVVVIDLVDHAVSLRCPSCGHRWMMDQAEVEHLPR